MKSAAYVSEGKTNLKAQSRLGLGKLRILLCRGIWCQPKFASQKWVSLSSCHSTLMRWIKFRKPANKVSYLSRQSSITRFKEMVNLLCAMVLSVPERDKSKHFCLLLPEDSFNKSLSFCCFLCLTPFTY